MNQQSIEDLAQLSNRAPSISSRSVLGIVGERIVEEPKLKQQLETLYKLDPQSVNRDLKWSEGSTLAATLLGELAAPLGTGSIGQAHLARLPKTFSDPASRRRAAERCFASIVQQIAVWEMFHADPHEGNLLSDDREVSAALLCPPNVCGTVFTTRPAVLDLSWR